MRSATAGFHPAIRQGLGLPAYYSGLTKTGTALPRLSSKRTIL
ncbi:TPA: hypothetical protein ACFU27_000504 [Neisseria meningitidis]|nr:AzlC family protein [Neisseria meningitidis]ARB68759.1 AzlC family protein [Neisseria meningitidis]